MWNIFENCWLLLTLSGFLLVAASIYRQVKPEHGHKPLLLPLVVIVLAFALDAAVRTDYEYIEYIMDSCKKAAVQSDAKGILRFVSPNYSDSAHRNKMQLESAAEHIIKAAAITKVRAQSHTITLNGKTAQSQFEAAVHMNANNQYTSGVSLVFVGLKFDYEKIGKEWFIKRAEVSSVNYQPMDWGNVH